MNDNSEIHLKKIESYYEKLNLHKKTNEELHELYTKLMEQNSPFKAPIYTATDKMPMKDRLEGAIEVVKTHYKDLPEQYIPALKALKDRYKGQDRCFVIGNGPSLNKTDLLALKNEVTFCVNSFFLKIPDLTWLPTFFLTEDHLVAEDRAKWINSLSGMVKLFPTYLRYCLDKDDDTIFFNHQPRVSYPHGFDFTEDASEITYTGCTVTFTALQIAAYLGFKNIYLIGVDADYEIPADVEQGDDYHVGVLDMKSDDPNHFHPDYFGKGFRWHDPQVHKMIEAYHEARKATEKSGQKIWNAGVGGKLEVFDRVDFSNILPDALTSSSVRLVNEAREIIDSYGSKERLTAKKLKSICQSRTVRR